MSTHEVLVALDFSDGSRAALEQAAFIAKQTRAGLHALHVWQVPEFVPPNARANDASTLAKAVETQARRDLDSFVFDARASGIAIDQAFTECGLPSAVIVEVAKRGAYELIVLGTHGRTGIAHALLGSVAERVLRRAPCPVLVVRADAPKPRALRRILAPVDYSEGARRALTCALDFSRSFGAEVEVVHVWDRPSYVSGDVIVHGPGENRRSLGELMRENAAREMQEFLGTVTRAAEAPRLSQRLLSGEPASTLIAELEKGEHDLVVLGTHGRSGFRRLLLGSTTEKLVRYSAVPVLVVPPLVPARE
ncbi:MAG TPA: universal stress protein [Polyangiaceae bacterium]